MSFRALDPGIFPLALFEGRNTWCHRSYWHLSSSRSGVLLVTSCVAASAISFFSFAAREAFSATQVRDRALQISRAGGGQMVHRHDDVETPTQTVTRQPHQVRQRCARSWKVKQNACESLASETTQLLVSQTCTKKTECQFSAWRTGNEFRWGA